jgi:hypothetical protein
LRYTLVLTLMISGCVEAPIQEPLPNTWNGQCYKHFDEDVAELAGDTAVDCGFVSMRATDARRKETESCARKAVKSVAPFKFGYESLGYDSVYCDIAVRRADGQMISLYYDSDITGQFGSNGNNSAASTARCTKISFSAGTIGVGSFFDLKQCTDAPEIFSNLSSRKLRD